MFDHDDYELYEAQKHACRMAKERDEALLRQALETENEALRAEVDALRKSTDLWRCTVCGRVGTVGRCCGEETRERANMEHLLAENERLLRELRRETERRWESNRLAAQEYVEDMRDVLKEAAQICKDLDKEALVKEGRLACGAECAAAIEALAARMNVPFERAGSLSNGGTEMTDRYEKNHAAQPMDSTTLEQADDHAHICFKLAEQYKSDPVLFAALTDAAAIIRDLMRGRLQASKSAQTAWQRGFQQGLESNRGLAAQAKEALRKEREDHENTNKAMTDALLMMEEREQRDEALLRQTLEALERGAWDTLSGRNAAFAIRERLGERITKALEASLADLL